MELGRKGDRIDLGKMGLQELSWFGLFLQCVFIVVYMFRLLERCCKIFIMVLGCYFYNVVVEVFVKEVLVFWGVNFLLVSGQYYVFF